MHPIHRSSCQLPQVFVTLCFRMEDLFKIFIVDVAEAERMAQSANTPHHHDYEELNADVQFVKQLVEEAVNT